MMLSDTALEVKPSTTLNILAKANRMKAKGLNIIDFGAGEPDFDTPVHIKEAAIKAINDNFTKYTPSQGTEELRKAICHKLKKDNNIKYNRKQIVVSNGSKHSLYNAFMSLINPKDEVIIPAPYWVSYPEMVKLAGGTPIIIDTEKENCFKVKLNQLKEALTDKTKVIVINSPSNPTGMIYNKKELENIAEFAVQNNLFVISDEIYEKFIYNKKSEHISIASLNDEIYKRTIVVNGLSKSYAMTGWRIGYTASNEQIAQVMTNIQSHSTSNPNSIAQKAALAALEGDQKCVENMKTEFSRRRDYIYHRISDIPLLSSLMPEGAFYLFVDISKLYGNTVKGKNIKNAFDVAEILLEHYNTSVIPCVDFGFKDYIRISYAVSMENIEHGINMIEKFVKENY